LTKGGFIDTKNYKLLMSDEPKNPDTNALEDILAFFKSLPSRLSVIVEKAKQSIFKPGPIVTSNPSLPTTPVIASASEATPPPFHEQQATTDENPFPKITRKNFYKHPIFWARFLGYVIPLSFLLYVLYLNYLPFGYHKTFTINVGSANDTTPSEFYIEPSKDLSDRMTNPDGSTYRTLNGMATAVFKPNAVLKNVNITVEVKGDDGISLIPPQIDFDPNSVNWDYDWNFINGVPEGLINDNNRAFVNDDGTYFDGTARVEIPKSNNTFENAAFTVYAEWLPTEYNNNFQQIVGHYNWELLQDKEAVRFQVGRMNDATGLIQSITYPINSDFFYKKHTAVAIYSPEKNNGYIELYIDGNYAGRTNITSDIIWKDYNGTQNLTFGKSNHGVATFFKGALYRVSFKHAADILKVNKISLMLTDEDELLKVNLVSKLRKNLSLIKLYASK
jgi:hypothetical protein